MSDLSTGSESRRAESSGQWTLELRARLSSLRLSPAREAEIIEELSQHLDDRRQELIMVLTNACVLLAAGLIVGGVSAWYVSATAKTFLFGLDATDPRAFAAAIASLSLAALVASIIPARRAASVDPVVALRAE